MIKLFAPAAALAILASAAAAQTIPSPPPGPGGPEEVNPDRRMMPPGPHIKVEFGRGREIALDCGSEPFKSCLDAANALIDKVMPAMTMRGGDMPHHMRGDRPRHMGRDDRRPMRGMMRDMDGYEPSGDTGQDFAARMAPHHRSAVTMAEELLRDEDADPRLKEMARRIVTEQSNGAAELEDWLRERQR